MPALRVGARLGGGEDLLSALGSAPTFRIVLAPDQLELVPIDTSVTVHHTGGTWEGRVSSAREDGDTVVLDVEALDGRPVCGNACANVPVDGTTVFAVDVTVVPTTSGPTVPVAALISQPDGSVTVVTADGEERPVRVLQAADGLAVVEGIAPGQSIQLFPEPSPTQ